ncbi:MAG: hypothetical protein HN564_04215, partial [Flavobacteriales bacterium]|nr:hypothetical protein [Flavobacteriales bacterium]
MTLEEFIAKANKKHKNKFDYSQAVQFKNQLDKVTIICPKGHKNDVQVGNHLGGSGCPDCAQNRKKTTEEFLNELKEAGFFFDEYDYSLVDYQNKGKKVIVIDKKFDTKHSLLPRALLLGTRCSGRNLIDGYLSCEEAKEFFWNKNFKNNQEFYDFMKSDERPWYIPSDIRREYIDKKCWKSEPDFIGTKKGWDGEYRDWEDALKFVWSLKLKSSDEWVKYCASGKKPYDIPSNPHKYYKEFISGAHWLGYLGTDNTLWTKHAILSFIKNLENELQNLDSIELVTVINSNNLARRIKNLGYLEELISSKAGSLKRDEIIKNIISSVDSKKEEFEENNELEPNDALIDYELSEASVEDFIIDIESEESNELEDLKPIEQLKYFDNKFIIASLDNENVDFLLKNQLKKLWNNFLNGKVTVNELEKEKGGKNFNQIKKWFFKELNEINEIKLPKDYKFKYEPNDMQKLIAYRLKKEKRYGNWSGTGAGKTLAALFSGRYLELKNTVIVCNNATVKGWLKSSQEY